LQIHRKQSRRPDFTVTGDQIANCLGGGANQPDSLQNAGDVAAVPVQLSHVLRAVASIEQGVGDDTMAFAQLIDPRLDDVFLPLSGRD
jgi:hypothetical protein